MANVLLDFLYFYLPYITALFFIIFSIYRLISWFRVPMVIKWPLSPTPKTNRGIAADIVKELVTFRTIYKTDDVYWLAIFFLHISFFFILLHVVTFIFSSLLLPDPFLIFRGTIYPLIEDWLTVWTTFLGIIAAIILIFILLRRILVKEVREITLLRDYFELLLLLIIITLGVYMRIFNVIPIEEALKYFYSLATLNPIKPPENPIFILHCILAQLYIIYFPFSRCFHIFGYFVNGWIVRKGIK